MTLFELLTGRLPFDSTNLGELLRQVAQAPAPALHQLRPELPPDWARPAGRLLARLMAKQAAQRPASAAELVAPLQALAAKALGGANDLACLAGGPKAETTNEATAHAPPSRPVGLEGPAAEGEVPPG